MSSKTGGAKTNCQSGSQVMLRRFSYHGAFDGGAAVGQEIDVAALLLHDPAHRHGAHFQDRRVLETFLASQILHLRRFRRGHHLSRQLDNTVMTTPAALAARSKHMRACPAQTRADKGA